MKRKKVIELSKCIIEESFNHAIQERIDDLQLIKEIKRIIQGSLSFSKKEDFSQKEIKSIHDTLRVYTQEKYLLLWKNSIEDDEMESFDLIMKEGLETFEHLYENEEHKF
jgi:hypothetical protein